MASDVNITEMISIPQIYLWFPNTLPISIYTQPLRCRAIKRQMKWSAPKSTNFEIDVGRGSGTLMKPKSHYMGVGGLLVRELEPEKDLKAEKG